MIDPQALERMARSRPRGIRRFVGGKFDLDRLVAATATSPGALQEMSRARVERLRNAREAEQRRVADARREGGPESGTQSR